MRRIKIALWSIGTLFFLSGCGGISYIGYDRDTLMLQMDQNQLILHGRVVAQKRDNFSSLFLTQEVIQLENGTRLVYEKARTDMSYEFEPMITRTVKIVFEAVRIATVYNKNHLFVYQVLLTDGKVVNVIAQQDNTQELKLLYGMRSTEVSRMLKQLDPDAPKLYNRHSSGLPAGKEAILTKWDTQKVHFVPLVIPLARFMGPF